MIQLTRLNGKKFTLNAMMIEQIQSLPDTTITLLNNKTIVVKEPLVDVIALTTSFYQKVGIQRSLNKVGDVRE